MSNVTIQVGSAPISVNVTGAQGSDGSDAVTAAASVKSASFTAALDATYHVVANATVTDPTPTEGKGYVVFVRNGTATISGTSYAIGKVIRRVYHSGSWASYVYDTASAFAAASHTHTSSQISDASASYGAGKVVTRGSSGEVTAGADVIGSRTSILPDIAAFLTYTDAFGRLVDLKTDSNAAFQGRFIFPNLAGYPSATATVASLRSFVDSTAADAVVSVGDVYWDTTLEKARVRLA